jgi:MoaA/NifB/PqqE/SkfB family radical SAM enzyme
MAATRRIDNLKAPLFVTWQLTRDCNLCCVHCCTDSAPGKRLPDELDAGEAERLAQELVRCDVPYVMLCGGEPLVVPHFLVVAEILGRGGVQLKIETNGQLFDAAIAERLARLPVRSIQVSLDGDTQETYARQRPGASLAKAHAACRAVRAAGLPLEITFAPTRNNIGEAEAVIDRAAALGAFRFNTGRLMRIGTAARLWLKLAPTDQQYVRFRRMLMRKKRTVTESAMKLSFAPFTVAEGLRQSLVDPPAVLLVLPNGWVKAAAALPYICADLRRDSLTRAWDTYREAWRDARFLAAAQRVAANEILHAGANVWQPLPKPVSLDRMEAR